MMDWTDDSENTFADQDLMRARRCLSPLRLLNPARLNVLAFVRFARAIAA